MTSSQEWNLDNLPALTIYSRFQIRSLAFGGWMIVDTTLSRQIPIIGRGYDYLVATAEAKRLNADSMEERQ